MKYKKRYGHVKEIYMFPDIGAIALNRPEVKKEMDDKKKKKELKTQMITEMNLSIRSLVHMFFSLIFTSYDS